MNVVEKNGQPSMEEILASIRRIIAEEPNGPSPVIDLRAKPKQQTLITSLIDEQPDFELPAIFRPNAQQPEKSAPLFGRLTDAIRNASGVSTDSRMSRPADDSQVSEPVPVPQQHFNGHPLNRHALNGHAQNGFPVNGHAQHAANGSNGFHPNANNGHWPDAENNMPEPALSQLNLARDEAKAAQPYELKHHEAHAGQIYAEANGYNGQGLHTEPAGQHPVASAVSDWWHGNTQPAAELAASSGDIKREMVPFKDQKMSRMSSLSSPAPAADTTLSPFGGPASEPAAQSNPSQAYAMPMHMDVPDVFQMPALPVQDHNGYSAAVSPPNGHDHAERQMQGNLQSHFEAVMRPVPPYNEVPAHVPQVPPMPPPAAEMAPGGVEDTTADLLRPMLRQWLAENMPRMVEKALHIEVAESVRSIKKPGAL